MPCPRCGGELPSAAKFCPSCGYAADGDAATMAPQADVTRPPQSSSGWLSSSDSISHGRFAPGTVLDGRYRIIGMLGKGGMGEVYRADDMRLGQPVALKFLPDSLRYDSQRLAQFHNEVRTAREVSHPNVCRVHDIGEVNGQLYLSMEYVDGEDLFSSLRRMGRFPEDRASEIARQICAGLAAAHHKGVIHRDLKPANVMLDGEGRVRLMDFGLANIGGATDIRAGTPAYMAPEQLLGKEVSARSDIFALGLVMYELFTGRRAFTANTLDELLAQHDAHAIAPPSSLVTNLDESIDRAIMRCLEPDPARRAQSALAVAAALPGGDPLAAALAAGETPSPEMVAASGEGAGFSLKVTWPLLIGTLAGLIVSLVLGLRTSPFDRMTTDFTPEVLAQKARDAIKQIGHDTRARDEAYGFRMDAEFIAHASNNDKPNANWSDILPKRPSILTFWYRRADEALWSSEFHTDLMTPGIVTEADPPETQSGMTLVELDHLGHLQQFVAIPAQRLETPVQATPVDWAPMFQLAGLDISRFEATPPLWTHLAASDTRVAWTGAWPESGRPLRIEAAALGGTPVAFTLIGPWRMPWRMPNQGGLGDTSMLQFWILLGLCVFVLGGAGLMARRNIHAGRGDRQGAAKLATATVLMLLALWVFRQHAVADFSVAATFFVAAATAVAYGMLMWTIYLALEPFVRRHWPQVIISWTSLVTGRANDPVVGRDVLVGVALGAYLSILFRAIALQTIPDAMLAFPGSMDTMLGMRGALGDIFEGGFYSIRNVFFYFFILFVLRVLLKKPWLAVLVFTAFFSVFNALSNSNPWAGALLGLLYFGVQGVIVWRYGLLSVVVGSFVNELMFDMVASTNLSAWYVSNSAVLLVAILALLGWGFYSALKPALARMPPAAQRSW